MPEVILVAGRGPLAARAIRSCQAAGAKAVAVHSEVDSGAGHVRLADESVLIGPATPEESYLDVPSLVEAAQVSGADALLPVHAVLAGSSELATATSEAGLLWIGADPAVLTEVNARGWGSAAVPDDLSGWVIGLADGLRVDGLVVGQRRTGQTCLCWSSSSGELAGDDLPPSARILADLSDAVAALGWRGLVSIPFGSTGSALGVRGGVPAELGSVELRGGRDLVQAGIALAAGDPQPAGTPGLPAAVGGSLRAVGLPAGGRPVPITEFAGPTGGGLRWEPGYAAGDALWPGYDPLLATVAVPGADLAGALSAFLEVCSSVAVRGPACDLDQLKVLAGEARALLTGPSGRSMLG